MINKELQERVIKTVDHPFKKSSSFSIPSQKKVDLIKQPSYGLLDFLKKFPKCIVLSKACRKVKGVKYLAVLCIIAKKRKMTNIFAFKDTDYIKPVKNYCDVLVNVGLFVEILQILGLTNSEIKQFKQGINSCVFNINNYIEFLNKKSIHKAISKKKSEERVLELELDENIYYRNDSVHTPPTRLDFIDQYVESNKKNATEGEKRMQALLNAYHIEFEFQKPCLVFGRCYIMDFFLTNYGICIEVDGGYHNTEQQMKKDIERTNLLARSGVMVVRFTNEQVFEPIEIRRFFINVLGVNL